jgi:hypothetical protein
MTFTRVKIRREKKNRYTRKKNLFIIDQVNACVDSKDMTEKKNGERERH